MPPNITTVVANVTTEQLPKARGGSGRAFVTFLAGNGDYVKGVVGLAKGLRKAKSMYPLVVAVLPDVPEEHREILKSQGCIVREIEPVYPPENQTQFAMAYYVINYSKLRIWEFVEYKKTIYLDGDIQVFGNIDHLFDLPDNYFYAVMDCFSLCQHLLLPNMLIIYSYKLMLINDKVYVLLFAFFRFWVLYMKEQRLWF
uniref:Hexosyltransferase n=1 Tax=Glycine max TaxID=3847 RepID=C6T9G8_SOYBN|nr:unknown [Glycine max]